MERRILRRSLTCIVMAAAALLAGCETLSLTALGIGGSAAVNHRMNGTPARTFTLPLFTVRMASIGALERMGIKTDGMKQIANGEIITASAGGREIEVELESITPNATRMRVVARTAGFFSYDGATASEIIVQTEKGLGV
jgi:hypothetical protein